MTAGPSLSTGVAQPLPFPGDHPGAAASGRIGVLLVNLGTPDAPTYWPMRRYLKEFLSDRRVIEVSRLLWWPLLNGIILTTRPGKSGAKYASIWDQAENASPLLVVTRRQTEKLARAFAGRDGRVVVDFAMRYGSPSIAERLDGLRARGCDRILIVPLYPQYAAATTATVCDKAFEHLMTLRWQPAVRIAPQWHDDPVYIEALAASVRASLAGLDFEPEVVLASFHGVPKTYLLAGDPYHCFAVKTGRLLREALGYDEARLRITFQSRFGKEEWLKPYTDETVEGLAKAGVKRIAIVAPGFVADCLETLEELGVENREIFLHHGGEKFAYLPCLNDSEEGQRVLEHVVGRELQGWI
ncbi:ferrochelatase [Labrys monachus]|uniref:Ferrochelatase n=1 Tax=Labrys monachus TaxID=217067 RepID=A0ABU0FPX6_9HYPH|nr:ferrochelatase [Labrys monachus]MDQ0396108.1 ferrochelatase [Labrys monachus]